MSEVATQQSIRSVQMVRIGGVEYPQTTVSTCKVCQSPKRLEIEEAINVGMTYANVERKVVSGEENGVEHIFAGNISAHYRNGHMNPSVDAMRTIAERRADRMARSVEVGEGSIVDSVSLAEVVVQKTWEGIADGSIKPKVRDGLAAAKLLTDLGMNDPGLDIQAYVEAYNVFHAEAKSVMGEDLFREFVKRLDSNSTLQALAEKFEQAAPSDPEATGA